MVKRAQAVSRATGVSFSKAYRAIVENPDPEQKRGNNITSFSPALAANFMDQVADYQRANKCSFKDAYLRVRKAVGEDVFGQWLQSVQG